ncbi:MAG: hypothetical protein P4L71_18400 [Acetobacteraceae bacterium]|nr:hypothetical protein [Acetobacteraceae bacterium]
MPNTLHPFRLAYRSFDRVVYDRVKSDNIFTLRGFDLACAGHVFPGYVLERAATHHPAEARFLVLGETGGLVLLLAYTRLGRTCRLMTGWVASPQEAALWFHPHAAGEPDRTALRGRFDARRLGTSHPDDAETRPVLAPRDLAATHAELTVLRERMIPPGRAIA